MSRVEGRSFFGRGVVAVAVLAVGVAACDGPNRFTGIGGDDTAGAPSAEVLQVPPSLPVGDSIRVEARVRDPQGVTSVTFVGRTLRGDPSLGTDESVVRFEEKTVTLDSEPTDTTIVRFLQPTEDGEREVSYIVVQATDAQDNSGLDSASVDLGGPSVALINLASPQAGTDFPIQLEASDPDGISSVRIDIEGALDTTLVREVSPIREEVALDTLLFIPDGLEGELRLTAEAVNTRGRTGTTNTSTVAISQGGAADDAAPALSMELTAPDRLELQNQVLVTLTGRDDVGGTGVQTAGVTVLAISPSRRDTLLSDTVVNFSRPRSSTVSQTFTFQPFNVNELALPDTLNFEVTGYFVDGAGNCGATTQVEGDEEQSLACANLSVQGATGVVAAQAPGFRIEREIVAGNTVVLPAGGTIMDAAVDTLRRNLFLSNIDRNRVEVFRLDDEVFGSAIGVGSEPWGLTMLSDFVGPDPDSLVVANSNGTNLEMVDLDREEARPDERFFFPDVVLFNFIIQEGDAGITFVVEEIPDIGNLAFSDRPQFIAVDTFGSRVFSTIADLEVGEVGTVRKSFFQEGWDQPETKIFVEHAAFAEAEDAFAFAHIDDITTTVDAASGSAVVTLIDHVPGFPDSTITGSADIFNFESVTDAWAELRSKGSDAFMNVGGTWSIGSLGFQDTTFVAASGDGTVVAIGEGAQQPLGRVLLYEAAGLDTTNLTGSIPVADLLTNRPEGVQGIGMNYDGTIGVVRGETEVAFFDSRLRKQGGTADVTTGGAGAALHPLHANQKTLFNLGGVHSPDTHLAFVGTGDGTIDVIDTFRFLRIGSIVIRDVVSGPIRAVLPFPGDNAGENCPLVPVTDKRGVQIGSAVQLYEGGDFLQPAPDAVSSERCIVVKLFAVTDSGGVVVVDVRKADILRFHPQRR